MKITVLVLVALLLFKSSEAGCTSCPSGFIDFADIEPTAIIETRYYGYHNFVGSPIPGYHAAKCILTKEAAWAAQTVQRWLLDRNATLKLYDCYRPQKAVDYFVEWSEISNDTLMKGEFYPNLTKTEIIDQGYVFPLSGHTRGSTMDVTIVPLPVPPQDVYSPGNPLYDCSLPKGERFDDNSFDFGTGYDCFSELSHTANPALGQEILERRLWFSDLMANAGFVNYEKEWWHFTLADEPFPDTYFDFDILP